MARDPPPVALPPLLFMAALCLWALPAPVSSWGTAQAQGTRSQSDLLPGPTQFEVAMLETLLAVKAGRVPDPASVKADGTRRSLLEELLPQSEDETAAETARRRRLASSWRFLGANIPFNNGPTLAALNASFYRYDSVSPASSVDWRRTIYITPIHAQYECASCWAVAAADSVSIATAIATKTQAVPAGVQQICDCSDMDCCSGGWPEDAFSFMVSQGNITARSAYQYFSSDGRNCTLAPNYPIAGQITGWERVPSFSQDALVNAVNMQPVLVYISASTKDFQQYTSGPPGSSTFNVYDGNCTEEVNHALLVVGYNMNYNPPYWILKNSWIPYVVVNNVTVNTWGDYGYMYIKMFDGPGKCGMLTVHPLYPIYFPNAPQQVTVTKKGKGMKIKDDDFWWNWGYSYSNLCSNIINPCGGGKCITDSMSNTARCQCPSGYVEIVGVPTSKCVDPSPCTSGLINPCGPGNCMDVGDGSYICGCPSGYSIGSRANGAPTCVPASATANLASSYTVQYGDTCAKIQYVFGVSNATFTSLNPYVVCGGYLVPGVVVTLPAGTSVCTQQYAIRSYDTCGEVAYYMVNNAATLKNWLTPSYWNYFGNSSGSSTPPSLMYTVPALTGLTWYSPSALLALNPSLNCSNLFLSQVVCVKGSSGGTASATALKCGSVYVTQKGDTCNIVQSKYYLNSTYFMQLNPGLNCNFNGNGQFYAGVQICVALNSSSVVNCTQWYTVQQGDTCAQIWNAANMSQYQMQYINPGLQCQLLYVGQQICINAPQLVNIPDPNYYVYTIQPNDTLSIIQSQFTSKCTAWSINVTQIALANNVSSWTTWNLVPGHTVVIPCAPKVGASCGCVPSLPVCGANNVNYQSYCDARCNFDTPVTSAACTACQNACMGRYGLTPSPSSACSAGTICDFPTWPPPTSDATAQFTTSPLCNYRYQTCQRACNLYATTTGYPFSTCWNTCYGCARVPCGGPSEVVSNSTGAPCGAYCPSTSCSSSGRSCATTCSYFNTFWSPLNP